MARNETTEVSPVNTANTYKTISFLCSIAIHLVILLILALTMLRTIVPEEEGGVLVNYGNVDIASGTFTPQYTGGVPPQPETPSSPPQPQADREDLLTQDAEESFAIEETRRREERRIAEQQQRREEERRRRENAINNRVAGAFGSGSDAAESQGDATTGAGNQGNPFGNSESGLNEGIGGQGSFNLNGRSIGSGGLPRPDYNVQEEGRIVISIVVDPRGDVISADIGRGTDIGNNALRQSAINAAKRAKFNSITGANNQSGTITYNYRLTQ